MIQHEGVVKLKSSFFSILLVIGVVSSGIVSCRKPAPVGLVSPESQNSKKPQSEILADSRREINSSSNFFFAVWDDSFTSRFSDLPASGGAPTERIPYSGHWYPEINGGTNVSGAVTKYDRAFNGGRPLAANWERSNHSLRQGDPGANWAGHCNGFSAASSRHKEPARSVIRNGITFEAQDIKALLAEIYMSAKYYFLGGNRCEQDRVRRPSERSDPTMMNECDDVNPGTFHVAIANWIGRKGYPVVTDKTVTSQVWNYPAYRYAAQVQKITRQTALQYIGVNSSAYIFNPAAEQFAYVNMTLYYANAMPSEPTGNVAPTHTEGTMALQYVLELNAADEIIGGEWVGNSQTAHPDFIWLALEPMQGSGTKYFGNPNVDVNAVLGMWAESVGLDPANPPPGLREPAWVKDWGKFPTFEVVLDESQTGAVFMGREVALQFKRRQPLQGDVELDVSVNGSSVTKLKPTGSDDVSMKIRPVPGVNRLDVVWRKGGVSFEERSLRFHAMN